MTKQTLHNIPNFIALQTDERFMGILEYLRTKRPRASSNEPHGMIQDCGRLEQFLQTLDYVDEAFTPIQGSFDVPRGTPYSHDKQTPTSKENSK